MERGGWGNLQNWYICAVEGLKNGERGFVSGLPLEGRGSFGGTINNQLFLEVLAWFRADSGTNVIKRRNCHRSTL